MNLFLALGSQVSNCYIVLIVIILEHLIIIVFLLGRNECPQRVALLGAKEL